MLDGLRTVADLIEVRPTERVLAGYLDAGRVAVDLVPSGWRRAVFTPGRPEATVCGLRVLRPGPIPGAAALSLHLRAHVLPPG